MEILDILKTSSCDLLPEDLDLFRTELAVGTYPDSYRKECLDRIAELEKWKKETSVPERSTPPVVPVDPAALHPVQEHAVPFAQQFRADLNAMRLSDKYKSSFRAYIKNHAEFDEGFVDANFSLFEDWEIEAVISELSFSEQFLEKYFSVLDKDKIARYQLFSERFYQKHFADFDAETVLKKGRNEWRKKENRSAQFAVFLRLKGIQD